MDCCFNLWDINIYDICNYYSIIWSTTSVYILSILSTCVLVSLLVNPSSPVPARRQESFSGMIWIPFWKISIHASCIATLTQILCRSQVLEDFPLRYNLKSSHKDVCMTAAFIDQRGHHKGLIFNDSLPVWPEAHWLTSLGNKVVAHYYQSPVGLPAWINKNLFSMETGAKNVTQ